MGLIGVCIFVVVVVIYDCIVVGNIGDICIYWFFDDGDFICFLIDDLMV